MRRSIIVLAVVLVAFRARQVNALIPVLDLSVLGAEIRNYESMLRQEVLGNSIVANTLSTFHEVQADVQQVTSLYNSVTGIRSIGDAANFALGQVGGDPLPFSIGSIEAMMTGHSPIALINSLGALGGSYNTNVQKLRLWTPSDPTTDAARSLDARIGVTAASQAIAEQQFNTAQRQMPLIRSLANQINNAKDGAERETLLVKLQGQSAVTQAAVLEALATQQMASAAKDADALRFAQQQQQSLHDFNAEADTIIAGRW
jgi:hypothetical protein